MRRFLLAGVAGAALLLASTAASATVVLTGDFVFVSINDIGTLGNGSNFPGLQHDPTGSGAFSNDNDYIQPGSPHDGFSIFSAESSFLQNSNAGGADFSGGPSVLLTGPDANGFANAATWTGGNGYATITNSYFFNAGDERIFVTTAITALQNLTGLSFGRSVDPDPDSNAGGGAGTNNQRGNLLFGPDDFIGSAAALTGRTLALVNLNGDVLAHGTQIGESCCNNISPDFVLANPGPLTNSDDSSLNMAWLIGDLNLGQTATINYAYAMGDKIDVVGGDPVSPIPEPATWATMILGFFALGAAMRRARRPMAFA